MAEELLSTDTPSYELQEHERIGFCFPTHGWQPPRIVRKFIRSLKFRNTTAEHYCYAVTTCGDSTGDTMTILNKELKAKGMKAVSVFSVLMPESYVCLPLMYTDTPAREQEKIAAARQQLKHICQSVTERRENITELTTGATPRLYSYVIGAYFNRYMINDRKFTVDTDVCTQCGRCQQVCPVGNIQGTPPVWQHNDSCTMCLACYHHCPVHAINYGSITRKRGQYYMKEKM
jgi:ferredoxin